MIGKSVDEITEQDLQHLIQDAVLEGKTLEYKQSLPTNSDADRKEFLADVSSFANASGGDLIYGITQDADTGKPLSLDGLSIDNIDQQVSRLDNMIRDGIEPRIPSFAIKQIHMSNSKAVLLIRIQKSWISPHRVSFQRHDRFYSRSSNGKYPLDVAELRLAFNLGETMTERIRNFKRDRISSIFANETPVPFVETAKTILHLAPAISFSPGRSYDIARIASDTGKLSPIGATGSSHRYNLDGFLIYSQENGISQSYVQLFRNGIIEAVEGQLLKPDGKDLYIPSIAFERELIQSLYNYLSALKTLNVELPIFIFLTLLGVKGYRMGLSRKWWPRQGVHTIDRDIIEVPEVMVENYDVEPPLVLKPCFDSVWNACGFERSLNYTATGDWKPR